MTKDGKDLQRLIRVIESARTAGKEIAIESPKYFVDRVTGERREHDVVLTIKPAHHEIVVALECRDRSRKVGVPEIEAFHTKCHDTGVHAGIIVSSMGFYETAKRKAKTYNIRCLTLDEVTGFDWFLPDSMSVFSKHMTHVHAQIDFDLPFAPRMDDIHDKDGRPLTNEAINQTALCALNTHHDLLPKEIGEHVVSFNIRPDLYAVIDGRDYATCRIVFTVTFENRLTFAPFRFRSYNDEGTKKSITQAAIANVQVGDRAVDFVASTESDGSIMIAVVPG
jgi:hypothetical protein